MYTDLTVTVNNTNDAPTVAHAIANQSVNEDSTWNYTVPGNTFSDVMWGYVDLQRDVSGWDSVAKLVNF